MVTLEDELNKKLKNGEISKEEYDELIKKFENLGLLDSNVDSSSYHGNWTFTGSKYIPGDHEIDEPVKVSGKLTVDGSLKCPELKISGSVEITDSLIVEGYTKISGKLIIGNSAIFAGDTIVSGKLDIDNDVKFMSNTKISGKFTSRSEVIFLDKLKLLGSLETESSIKLGNSAVISGKLIAETIKSNADLSISGKLEIADDVITDTFISKSARSYIGGSLRSRIININKEVRDEYYNGENQSQDLASFIINVIKGFVNVSTSNKIGEFVVQDNIEGENVDISYTRVHGDIIGTNIIIGPEVYVDGVIKYRDSVTIPEGSSYNIEKID